MSLKVGDTYFNRDGRPGVVIGRDPKSLQLEVEREGPAFETARTIGYINGLKPEEHHDFQSILMEMRQKPEVSERVLWLQDQIETLKVDPKRHVLTRYLEGELAHIMNSGGIYPRTYKVDEAKT